MTYESSYGTARLVAKLISFFGWIVLAGSIIAGVTIFSASERSDPTILAAVIGTAVGGFLSGIMLIATGQITRAVVDTADFNGEMLALLKTGIRTIPVSQPEPLTSLDPLVR